jgi:trehalose 6-phosphate phosphatase
VDRATLIAPFVERPADALVVSDFDGTLSPIVPDPALASPVDGMAEVLGRLATHVGEVAVVSGRPLAFLEAKLPEGVTLFGQYGLEGRRHGERVDHPSGGVWRETIADVSESARRTAPERTGVEPKGLSLTLHYRNAPDIEAALTEWATATAARTGLVLRPARMSIELHPPVDVDKGTVLADLAADHPGPVLFAGDDVGDLSAFEELGRLRGNGRHVVAVVVDSTESPQKLRDMADLLVDGPAEVLKLLDRLATGHAVH